jgi:hypothetical protein
LFTQIERKDKGERYIQITNWNNYWKMYKIEVFELCRRKSEKFLEHVKKMKFHCKISNQLKELIVTDIRLRKYGIIHEDRIINTNNISLKNLILLSSLKQLHFSYIQNNVLGVRTRTSHMVEDKDFFSFVHDLHIHHAQKS